MEQGLRLLLQLVLEFAPVIASLVHKSNDARPDANKNEYPSKIQEFLQTVNTASQKISYLGGFDQEKIEEQQLAVYYHQTQLQIATQEQETALKVSEVNKLFDSWPLRLYPSQILESDTTRERKPLKIFLAPPKVVFDKFDAQQEEAVTDVELMLAEGLRDFLGKHYSLQSPVRPTEFLAGAWDSKRFHSESSIKALFGMLKTEPILILESEADGDYLNFRIGYWGLGQEHYYYKTISQLPYREIVEQSAKNRALEWRTIRDELVALGENLEEINDIGRDNAINLATLEKEEKWKAKGVDISKLSLRYQINRQDLEQLCQVLITCHCLVAGWIADVYHLVHYDVPPLLPDLLPSLLKSSIDLRSLEAIASGYKQVYQALEAEHRYWIPELALQLGQSLSHLSDRSLAEEQVKYSIHTWLELHKVPQVQASNPLEVMRTAATTEDAEYFQKLKEYFAAVGDRQGISEVEEILDAIANFKHARQGENVYLNHTLTGHAGKITSVAISPDGEVLVSGCADKTIKVWNLKTGKAIRTLKDNLGEVSSVAVSPDGNFLAVGSCEHPKSNVKVWHLATGKLLHTLLGHQKPVNCVVISPDGMILASGSSKIKIWNLHKGDRICTLWHSSVVHAAAISPDSTILASASSDKKIRLWNPRTGEPLRTLNGHTGEVYSVVISPDGQILFSGSADKTIKAWELESGKMLHTFTGHAGEVKSVTISPDGQTLFSGSADKTIKIWCLHTGELLQTLTGHSGAVNAIAASPDGQFIASGSSDKTIKIWQIV
ncbi:WD40 repeat domain-containing protein [Fischerella sp. PCC 9605]|uniref:WD40 repeat domain-containing protein n=1 Tax=Fischerella sp. PCC 9605 TaxID=1173024 RepID=UPI00047E78DE|nr:WD40 repeat domain-containing protein [Fischerella sp. PCC 9605]